MSLVGLLGLGDGLEGCHICFYRELSSHQGLGGCHVGIGIEEDL